VSPILVRPVREQLEHDRIIRLLQARGRRKFEVGINPGSEQNTPVGTGQRREFPDVVLFSSDKGRKLQAVIEVETGESVNHLEALAQWAHYARLKVDFHLYVPAGSAESARRLCLEHKIVVSEMWTYHTVGDQIRFAQVYRSPEAEKAAVRVSPAAKVAATRSVTKVAKPPAPVPKRAAGKVKAPPNLAPRRAAPAPTKRSKPAAKAVKATAPKRR
jgi:hypothetical protein